MTIQTLLAIEFNNLESELSHFTGALDEDEALDEIKNEAPIVPLLAAIG